MATSSPSRSQDQQPQNSPDIINSNDQIQDQKLPDNNDDTRFPKTLTLEILNLNPQEADHDHPTTQNQEEVEDLTVSSPTTTAVASRRGGGGGRKGRKGAQKRRAMQGKKSLKKLETLTQTLNPIPFAPSRNLDFDSHETLLKKLGLWDFVHLQFDSSLRADLIAQLIANYNSVNRCSYVNGVRINVNRSDLGRALKLPVKKDKGNAGDGALEVKESEESIGFVEELVSNWILLHEDTWLMPTEILNWSKVIKEGNFEKVDWAGMIWFMVEKELNAVPELGNCYYASHLQLLIKFKKEELLKEENLKMEIDVRDDEDEEDVKMGEELKVKSSVLEEHSIELSLGGMDNVAKDEGEKDRKENVGDEDVMDFEERKVEEDQGQWGKSSVDGHFLRQCSLGQVRVVECDGERKVEEEVEVEEEVAEVEEEAAEVEEEDKGREEGGEEEEEEEEEVDGGDNDDDDDDDDNDDVNFHISPKGNVLDGLGSDNLIDVMEAAQIPFSSEVQIHDNASSGEFLVSRVDTELMPGSSSLFANAGESKRGIEHLENDMPHHSLNGGNKRIRSESHWNVKQPYLSFDMFEAEVQHVIGKARMMVDAKDQACQEMSMHQQALIDQLHQRNNLIQQLQKDKIDEQNKRQMEVYRLERELYMMGNLLEGYRKALKETHKAFAEYRAKCQLHEEPIYKDTESGGLVLSSMELEKQRLKQEEEERLNLLLVEKKAKIFEANCLPKFEAHENSIKLLGDRLMNIEKEFNLLKEMFRQRKASEKSECVATEECVSAEESAPVEASIPGEEPVPTEDCAATEACAPMEECAPTQV